MNKEIAQIIEKAIEAGKAGSQEIYDYFYALDESLGNDAVSNNVRSFFDAWSDAIGHDYMPYSEKSVTEWVSAAEEIKLHYIEGVILPYRKIWEECAVQNA